MKNWHIRVIPWTKSEYWFVAGSRRPQLRLLSSYDSLIALHLHSNVQHTKTIICRIRSYSLEPLILYSLFVESADCAEVLLVLWQRNRSFIYTCVYIKCLWCRAIDLFFAIIIIFVSSSVGCCAKVQRSNLIWARLSIQKMKARSNVFGLLPFATSSMNALLMFLYNKKLKMRSIQNFEYSLICRIAAAFDIWRLSNEHIIKSWDKKKKKRN